MGITLDSYPQLLTPKEAAAILSVHENTLRRWSDVGLIPTFRLGPRGDRRYFESDIRGYLQSGTFSRKGNLR